MNCRPENFYRNVGVVGLTRWIEKMEFVFQINFCSEDNKVRFVACIFMDASLTWWNDHVKTIGLNVENAMMWEELKVLLIEEYSRKDEM